MSTIRLSSGDATLGAVPLGGFSRLSACLARARSVDLHFCLVILRRARHQPDLAELHAFQLHAPRPLQILGVDIASNDVADLSRVQDLPHRALQVAEDSPSCRSLEIEPYRLAQILSFTIHRRLLAQSARLLLAHLSDPPIGQQAGTHEV